MKIAVIGLGGIGGYLGALLCHRYPGEITLIARGAALAAVEREGLSLHSDIHGDITARPLLVTDDPARAGVQDAVIVCTKSYGLAQALEQAKPMIGQDTVILPMLNGVNTSDRIKECLEAGVALEGCIYVYSRIDEPGKVIQNGALNSVHMGQKNGQVTENMRKLCDALNAAGVDTKLSDDISRDTWVKYAVIVGMAQTGAYFDVVQGEIRKDQAKLDMFTALMGELIAVGKAEGVAIPEDTMEKNTATMLSIPYSSTSSLHRDLMEPGKKAEVDIFCGNIVRLGEKHGIPTPANMLVYEKFKDRI